MSSIGSPRPKDHSRSAPSRNFERRPLTEFMPSRIHLDQESSPRKSPNSRPRSRYCSAELNNSEMYRRLSRNDSAPARRQETRDSASVPTTEEARVKDVMFLRKMLAMNKKQEMMLNKRLARLLEEEEFQNFAECRQSKNVVEPPQPTPPVEETKTEHVEDLCANGNSVHDSNSDHRSSNHDEAAVVEEKPTPVKTQDAPATKTVRKVEYDINGRRIYYYSDIDKDSTEEESEKKPKNNYEFKCMTVLNGSKTMKRGSACSKKMFTMKKSLTYIHSQGKTSKKAVAKGKKKVRHEDGDSIRADSEKLPDFEMRRTKVGCQGDGGKVQNVVVHCSTVYRNSSSTSKNNVKVWNYESLPSLKSDKSFGENHPVTSDPALQDGDDSVRSFRHRPISVRNDNIEIKFKNPPSSKDDGTPAVETVFFVHKKFSDA